MAEVTAGMIKELRDKTGVGMSNCKEALVASSGDMEAAIEYLRKKGIASAVKKESRDAKEGVIGIGETADTIALVEVSAETDFVTSNEVFQSFLSDVAQLVAEKKPATLEALSALPSVQDASLTVDEARAVAVQKVGENIQIRRFECIPKTSNRSVGVYSHMGGRIVAVVEVEGDNTQDQIARDVAMHVAAAHPAYLKPEDVPGDVLEKEKEIARCQIQGKPDHIAEKILEGKIKAYYDEACLSCQKFIKDESVTVGQFVAQKGKENNKALALAGFKRWSVGN